MSDDFELVRGSGNVFRDFDMPNPDLEQLRAILAAQIIKALDRKRLTVRKAAELTGIAAADFSRIRNANIGRFTVDRLMTVLGRLDQRVDVNVKVRPNAKRAIPVSPHRWGPRQALPHRRCCRGVYGHAAVQSGSCRSRSRLRPPSSLPLSRFL
jgi:predicted XRE-type DNA-binding protein